MIVHYNDGGRSAAGFKGSTGDCVTRAIAIVTGKSYMEVYTALNTMGKLECTGKRKRGKSSARTGVYKDTYHQYLISLGFKWTPTMFIGQGCKVHLRKEELPAGKLIVSVSRHLTAVIDGEVFDTHNPCREGITLMSDGTNHTSGRCVYGYYSK